MLRRFSSIGAALLLLVVVAQPVAATTIGPVVNASNDLYTNNEITIAHSPANPLNVITGWNDWNRNEGCGVSRSLDGGQTWSTNSFIPGITPWNNEGNTYPGNGIYDFAGDPAVTFAADGTAYFACYGYKYGNAAAPMGGVALFVSKSTDGGLTWGRPTKLATFTHPGNGSGVNKGSNGNFPDHDAIAADTWVASPYYGSVYIAQAQFHGNNKAPITLWYSRDGVHWSSMVTVSSGANFANQDAIPFVGPDGSVYVSFDSSQGTRGATSIRVAKSTNGGASFGPSNHVADMIDPVNRDLANSDYRAGSYPAPGIDAAGRITIAWNDRRSGASNMWYTRAWGSDLTTWTAPTQLKPSAGEQFFPWVHSAPNGRVDIVYYDRTRDPNDVLNYVTYSRLDPTSGLAVTAASYGDWSPAFNGNIDGGQLTTACNPFIGDYIGVSSDNTHVYLGWTGNGPSVFHDEFGNPTTCDVNQDTLTIAITP
ncbi:MAG: glycoside hydrolase [Chloroflexota bacterium]|nr:glycoside hydrolase [Chloroflexota bacterium]